MNDTFDARADFIGLDLGFTIRNINTSTDLFTSNTGFQDFNATFTSGQTITIQFGSTPTPARSSCNAILSELNFSTFDFIAIFAILSVFIIISVVAVTVFVMNGDFSIKGLITDDMNLSVVKVAIIEIMLIAIVMIITLIVVGSMCGAL